MDQQKLDFSLTNYHSHTYRCMHALDTEEEYIRTAIDCGYSDLGFSDHTPWPYQSEFVADMRMHISELQSYIETLKQLRKKYSGKIDIHIGLECEAFPEYYDWLRDLKSDGAIEYCILGNHYDTTDEYHTIPYFGRCYDNETVQRYVQTTVNGMESGIFTYLCHPDLYLNAYPSFDKTAASAAHAICEAAESLRMPLEYNILGLNRNPGARKHGAIGYTSDEFWKVAAEYDITAVIGIDAHSASAINCVDTYIEIRKKLERLGIPVLDKLPV